MPQAHDSRAAQYVAAAVEAILADLLAAPHGGRNAALNRASFDLGQLAARGVVARADAASALHAHAARIGISRAEARATIKSGLHAGARRPRRLPHEIDEELRGGGTMREPADEPVMPADAPPSYLPREDVLALWRASLPVTQDPETSAYLEHRGIDPRLVAVDDMARAMSASACPAWARHRPDGSAIVSWSDSGHRLLVPMLEAGGEMRSLAARCVRRELPSGYRKSTTRGARRGLVMACPYGAIVLASGAALELAHQAPLRVIICEGEVDFLRIACGPDGRRPWPTFERPAVLGMVAGSWTDEIASRVPDGAEVVIATDEDESGHAYADKIIASLTGRCHLYRHLQEAA